jgi:hypothetical protein
MPARTRSVHDRDCCLSRTSLSRRVLHAPLTHLIVAVTFLDGTPLLRFRPPVILVAKVRLYRSRSRRCRALSQSFGVAGFHAFDGGGPSRSAGGRSVFSPSSCPSATRVRSGTLMLRPVRLITPPHPRLGGASGVSPRAREGASPAGQSALSGVTAKSPPPNSLCYTGLRRHFEGMVEQRHRDLTQDRGHHRFRFRRQHGGALPRGRINKRGRGEISCWNAARGGPHRFPRCRATAGRDLDGR